MPFERSTVLLTLLAVASFAPASGAGAKAQTAGPAATVHELDRRIAVDGALTEWAAVPPFVIPFRSGQAEAGQPPRARLGYDSRYLYLALEVPDDTLAFPERSWRFGDGFYVTVLMPAGGEASASHISFGFSRAADRLERVVVNRSGEYFPAVDPRSIELAMSPGPSVVPTPGGGPVAWEGIVVYEVAVPWSLLAPANPLTEDSITLNIVTVDRDGGRTRRFAMLMEDPDFDTERTPVRRGRRLPLVRRPAASETALAVRLARPVIELDHTIEVVVGYRPAAPAGTSAHGRAAAGGAPTAGDAPTGMALLQEETVVAVADVTPAADVGEDVGRAVVRLLPGPGAVTGPATLRVRTPDTDDVEVELFLVDRAGLEELRRELEAIETDGEAGDRLRASVPTPLVRLAWLLEFADSAPANASLEAPRTWWQDLSALSDSLRRGVPAIPRTAGPHRVAHRSGIDGSLQPYSIHLPDGYDPHRAGGYPALVALHGSGVAEHWTARSAGGAAAAHDWVVVAPLGRGLSDWYTGDAEIDVVEALDHAGSTLAIDPARVHLAGFSMGGYGTWRLALRHGHRFRTAAVLAGAPCAPASAGGECVADLMGEATGPIPPLLVVHGARDQAVPIDGVRPLVERVRPLTDLEYREIDDAGHGAPTWWPMALEWMAGRQSATETGADSAVVIDASFARLAVSYLESRDPTLPDRIAATPAARVITEHAHRVTTGSDAPTRLELVGRLLAELDDAPQKTARLADRIDAVERDRDARRRCRAEAAAYLPDGALDGAVVHLTLGYDIGIALAGEATLNLAHPRFRDSPRELWFYCVHELHHAGFMKFHDLPQLAEVRTTTQLAALIRRLTFMEGLAVHAARGWRAAEDALDDDPDYVALGDPDRMQRYEDEYFRLLGALAGTPERPLEPADWEIVERMSGGDRLWYRVGAAMAERIEETLGRKRLLGAIITGPDGFFEIYAHALRTKPRPAP